VAADGLWLMYTSGAASHVRSRFDPLLEGWRIVSGINTTRLLVILLIVLVSLVLASFALWIVSHFVTELLLLFLAAVLASLLSPAVGRVQRRLGAPRPLAILAVYLGIGVVAFVLVLLFLSPVVEQARLLQARLPGLVHEFNVRSAEFEATLRRRGVALPAPNVASGAASVAGGSGSAVLGSVVGVAASIGTTILDGVLVLVMSFYLLNDRHGGRAFMRALPAPYATGAAFAVSNAGAIIGRYVRAQILVAATVAVLGGGGAAVLGVQYAPLIGIVAFLAESIPVLGPIIATVPAVGIALLESPWRALAVLAWFVVVQQLEQNVIMPRLSGHAVGIHPVAAIMAVLIGFDVGSVWGALFAVPVLGFLVALAREVWRVYAPILGILPAPVREPVREQEPVAGRSG